MLALGVHVVGDVHGQESIGLAVVGQGGRQRGQHVGVEVHPAGRGPVLGVGDDRGTVPAAAALGHEPLVLAVKGLGAADFPVGFEVGFPDPAEGKIGGVVEVEGLDAVRSLAPPVGGHAAIDVDRWGGIAVGGVVVIHRGIELDVGAGHDRAKGGDVHVEVANAQRQHVHQSFPDPGLDIQPVEAAAFQVLRNSSPDQQGPAAALGHLLGNRAKLPHEVVHLVPVGPGLARRQDRAHPGEVQRDAVVVEPLRDFPQNAQLVAAHFGNGVVPQADRPGPGVDQPFRVLQLHGELAERPQVVVGAVDAVVVEGFDAPFSGLFGKDGGDVDALLLPAAVTLAVIERHDRARPR